MKAMPIRGTLLNTLCVAVGALIGLAIRKFLPQSLMDTALTGLGLVTLVLGLKMALGSKNMLIVGASIALGGLIGASLGISGGIASMAEWARLHVGGDGSFSQVLITTSILFCVGPMTILGCLQDRLEGKIEILAMKSLLDGIASIFFAAVSGPAVLCTALVVLIVQGTLTMVASPLKAVATDEVVNEASATGGVLLLAIGFGLAKVAKIPAETYLPALFISPVLTSIVAKRRVNSPC